MLQPQRVEIFKEHLTRYWFHWVLVFYGEIVFFPRELSL